MLVPMCILKVGAVSMLYILYVGTVSTLCILDVGTVPMLCILNVGTVPTFSSSRLLMFSITRSYWHERLHCCLLPFWQLTGTNDNRLLFSQPYLPSSAPISTSTKAELSLIFHSYTHQTGNPINQLPR